MHVSIKSPHRFIRNQKGMTILEIMVASAIVMVLALGMSATFQSITAFREKADVVSTALTLESVLIAGFADTDSLVVGLDAGTGQLIPGAPAYGFSGSFGPVVPPATSGTIQTLVFNSSDAASGAPAQTYFKNDFSDCSAVGFSDPECVIRVDLSVRALSSLPGETIYGYAFAIYFNPKLGNIAPLGGIDESTGASVTNFLPYHYIAIPNKHASNCKGSDCTGGTVNVCNSATGLAAYGVNLITKQAFCMSKPSACPQADSGGNIYISKGINVDTGMGTQMSCTALRTAKCPTNYALNRLQTSSLETGASINGDCVFAAQDSGGNIITGGHISGQVCPSGYLSQSTCTIIGTGVNGTCPGGETAYPHQGNITFTQHEEFVDCEYFAPPVSQSCGSSWSSGQAQLTVKCVLLPAPGTVPAY